MQVDFGKTTADYDRHRRGFPAEFFAAVFERGIGLPGTPLLDLGCGTGALGLSFARRGARVTAIDRAREQLAALRRRALELGLEVALVQASAEATGLCASSFETITIGQAWHWFDAPSAARELRRLLAPRGRVLLASYDWLPLPGSVVERTEALILEHNPAWNMAGLDGRHPEWERDLLAAGFEILETVYEELPASYSHEDWRGRIRASAGVAASLSPAAVELFDSRLADLLREFAPADPLEIPHRYGFCLARIA
jgi:SAM-dependent methyltransferase